KVHVWDFLSGKKLHELIVPARNGNEKPGTWSNGIAHLAFAHDSKTLATSMVNGQDRSIRLWDVTTGKEVDKITGPYEFTLVSSLAFSPDDQLLVTGTRDSIRLWDIRSRKELEIASGHTASISGLAVSPDGQRLASAAPDGTVRLWEPATGKELHRIV